MASPPLAPYALTGPQVDPGASYWMYCAQLHIVRIEELVALTEDKNSPHFFPDPPGPDETAKEFEELVELSHIRDDPCKLVNPSHCRPIEGRPCRRPGELPRAFGCRRPISKFLNLAPPPLGAVMMNRFPGEQIIRTGRGMARAVESETPGLYHRHALNYLIGTRSWSPPRQALVWAALDVALASALQAAWYYKWLNKRTAFRERPAEYDRRVNKNSRRLQVLFDRPDELNPAYNLCPDGRPDANGKYPDNDSGTPRHPAYPSGHSTYSGAASEILTFFFGQEKTPPDQNSPLPALLPHPRLGSQPNTSVSEELDDLADNIGMGRLWAGIHWRSDHEAGMKLGRTVACLVLQQLARMECPKPGFMLCTPDRPTLCNQCELGEKVPCPDDKPPTREDIERAAEACKKSCNSPFKPDIQKPVDVREPCDPPPPCIGKKDATPGNAAFDANRGVQRGGQ